MHPLVKAATAAAVLAALGRPAPSAVGPAHGDPAAASGGAAPRAASPARSCPRGSALLLAPAAAGGAAASASPRGACVPLPAGPTHSGGARRWRLAHAPPGAGYLRTGAPDAVVPLLPGRPSSFSEYQLPVDPVLSAQLGGGQARTGGPEPPGLHLATDPGSVVSLVDLEGQIQPPTVVLVGDLFGVTVAVHHRTQRGEQERDYLALYGRLDRPGPNVVSGAALTPMSIIGYTAQSGGQSELYLEIREQLPTTGATVEHLSELVRGDRSIAIDPRNVLPLRR